MSRKKPTIKELNEVVLENRRGLEIAFKSLQEMRAYMGGIDRLLDWYVEYKEDTDGYKKFIEENKIPEKSDNTDGAENGVSDKQQDVSEEEPSEVVSEETK